jgi:hypothetical protein
MNRISGNEMNTTVFQSTTGRANYAPLDMLRRLLLQLHWRRSSHAQGLVNISRPGPKVGSASQVIACVAIEGDMKVDRLQAALQMIVARHLTLRRCLRSPLRGLRLWGHAHPVIRLEQEDVAGFTVEILDAMVREDSLKPLSEVNRCVCRGHLYCRGHNDWLLLLVVDSIAADAGSIARWLEELTELRNGHRYQAV